MFIDTRTENGKWFVDSDADLGTFIDRIIEGHRRIPNRSVGHRYSRKEYNQRGLDYVRSCADLKCLCVMQVLLSLPHCSRAASRATRGLQLSTAARSPGTFQHASKEYLFVMSMCLVKLKQLWSVVPETVVRQTRNREIQRECSNSTPHNQARVWCRVSCEQGSAYTTGTVWGC